MSNESYLALLIVSVLTATLILSAWAGVFSLATTPHL